MHSSCIALPFESAQLFFVCFTLVSSVRYQVHRILRQSSLEGLRDISQSVGEPFSKEHSYAPNGHHVWHIHYRWEQPCTRSKSKILLHQDVPGTYLSFIYTIDYSYSRQIAWTFKLARHNYSFERFTCWGRIVNFFGWEPASLFIVTCITVLVTARSKPIFIEPFATNTVAIIESMPPDTYQEVPLHFQGPKLLHFNIVRRLQSITF